MRRTVAASVVTLLMLAALGPVAVAQNEGHAAVGAWAMEDGGTAVLHADGTFSSVDPDGGVAYGSWAPTGDDTVEATFNFVAAPGAEGAPPAIAVVRFTATLADEGMTTQVNATVELPTPDGGTTGQLGPIEFSGTRIVVEAPGEPVGPFPPPAPPDAEATEEESLE